MQHRRCSVNDSNSAGHHTCGVVGPVPHLVLQDKISSKRGAGLCERGHTTAVAVCRARAQELREALEFSSGRVEPTFEVGAAGKRAPAALGITAKYTQVKSISQVKKTRFSIRITIQSVQTTRPVFALTMRITVKTRHLNLGCLNCNETSGPDLGLGFTNQELRTKGT